MVTENIDAPEKDIPLSPAASSTAKPLSLSSAKTLPSPSCLSDSHTDQSDRSCSSTADSTAKLLYLSAGKDAALALVLVRQSDRSVRHISQTDPALSRSKFHHQAPLLEHCKDAALALVPVRQSDISCSLLLQAPQPSLSPWVPQRRCLCPPVCQTFRRVSQTVRHNQISLLLYIKLLSHSP